MTVKEAYKKLKEKEEEVNSILNSQENVRIYSKIVNKMKEISKSYPEYNVSVNLENSINLLNYYEIDKLSELDKLIESIKIESEISNLNKTINSQLFKPTQMYEKAGEALKEYKEYRRTIIKVILSIIVCIAVGAAIFVIYGITRNAEWAGIVATILGTVDFVVGILSFSWERINDMKTQAVKKTMCELDKEMVKGSSQVNDLTNKLEKQVNQIVITCGCFNKTNTSINPSDSDEDLEK